MSDIKYNFGKMRRTDKDVAGKGIGYIEGWTTAQKSTGRIVNTRTVTVNGESKQVTTILLSVTLAKSAWKYAMGEDFETEQHFVECTAWDKVAERLAKFAPTPKMIVGVFGEIKVQEYDKNGGGKGKKLVMTIDDFKGVTKKQEGYVDPQSSTNEDDFTPAEGDSDVPF